MTRSEQSKKQLFHLKHYDKDFYLKVNTLSILVILVCCKGIFVSIAAQMAGSGAASIMRMFFFDELALQASIAAAAPSLLVLITWNRRHVEAKQIFRTLWAYGRILLLLSIVIHIAVDIYSLSVRHRITPTNLSLLAVDSLCLLYLLRSKLVSAIFKDFPEPLKED